MASSNQLTSNGTTPRRLVSDHSPRQINICVEESNHYNQQEALSPLFKAPCLFHKDSSLKNVVTQPAATSPDELADDDEENHINTGSSAEDMDKNEIESPETVQQDGFASQLRNYNMEPIMEAGETKLEIEPKKDTSKPSSALKIISNPDETLIDHTEGNFNRKENTTALNLSKVIDQKMAEVSPGGQIQSNQPPQMSSRRKQMTQPTPHEVKLEQKIRQVLSSSALQPILQSIWKVILTLCFEQKSLKAYMRKANLITVPVRALHYNEVMCLFRKAHGPLLKIEKIGDSQKYRTRKKASTITAEETVQGFANFKNFGRDVVSMLGDGILLLSPDMYTVVLQLVFEACSFHAKNKKGDDIIHFRRINDITSPFLTPITDNLPINRIFELGVLDQIVKLFCMKEISSTETRRLLDRRFIPSALVIKEFSAKPGDQLYDTLEKVMQHSHWKDNRSENASQLLTDRSPDGTEMKYSYKPSTMKKISHTSKHQRIVSLPANGSKMIDSESNGRCMSDITSDDGRNNEQYSTLGPKLPEPKEHRSTPLTMNKRDSDHGQNSSNPEGRNSPDGPPNNIETVNVKALAQGNTQYHITFAGPVPRTPQATTYRRRDGPHRGRGSQASQMAITDKNTEIASQLAINDAASFHGVLSQRQYGAPEKREIMSRTGVSSGQFSGYRKTERKHKLLDMMHKNHKYRKLAAMTKKLHDTNDIQELQQFAVHRANFDRLRENAAKVPLSGSGGSSMNDTFNIQINSKGKLEEITSEIHPIDEMKELKNDIETKPASSGDGEEDVVEDDENKVHETKQTQSTERSPERLFDFKPLLLQSGVLRANDSYNDYPEVEQLADEIRYDPFDKAFALEEQTAARTKDYMHASKTFNRQNLQHCRLKNKRLIASNLKQQNEMRQQRGYNTSLLTGQCLELDPKSKKKRRKSHNNVTKIRVPQPPLEDPMDLIATDRLINRNTTAYQTHIDSNYFNDTFAGSQDPLCDIPIQTSGHTGHFDPFMTTLQIGPNGFATFKPMILTGEPWSRRGSHPKNKSQMAQSSNNSNKPRLRQIGSPDSERSRITAKLAKSNGGGSELGDMIFCRTIPTMLKEIQSRQTEKAVGTMDETATSEISHAIPIRLHLAQANLQLRNEFSPVSVHVNGNMRDSLTAPSRTSREPDLQVTQQSPIKAEDDGICTVRAESHLEGKQNADRAHKQVINETNGKNGAKIVLVAPKTIKTQLNDVQIMRTRNTNPVVVKDTINSNATYEHLRRASDIQIAQNNVSQQVSHVSGGVSQSRSGVSGHVSGQVDLKIESQKSKDGHQKEANEKIVADYQPGKSRPRIISTADNQFRKKKTKTLASKEDKSHYQYKSEVQGESLDEIIEDHHKLKDKIFVEARQPNEDGQRIQTRRANNKMNFGDINRWQASLESPGLMMNNSDATGIHSSTVTPSQGGAEKSETNPSQNYQRQRPRKASDIELSNSSQPQKTVNSTGIDLSKRAERESNCNHDLHYQKGDFIAPRRAMTRKQRLNIKTPINLLAIHDCKGIKNLNLTIVNSDLVTSKIETETMNLSQSIRTPEARRRMRHASVQDRAVGRGRNQNATPSTLPSRTPTPIRIVDLSAEPVPIVEKKKLSLAQQYYEHFPILHDRQRPLKQDILRQVTNNLSPPANINPPGDEALIFKPPQDPIKIPTGYKTPATLQSSRPAITSEQTSRISSPQNETVDLKSMVSFLVRSPANTSPVPSKPNSPPRMNPFDSSIRRNTLRMRPVFTKTLTQRLK